MSDGETLRSLAFRRERESAWRELEDLLERVKQAGLPGLEPGELARLPVLHRAAASSLSVARAISLDRNLLDYLEGLTSRSYFAVYGTHEGLGRALRGFVTAFPREVRRIAPHVALSAAVLLAGVALGMVLTTNDLELYSLFVDPAMAGGRDPTATTEALRETLEHVPSESDMLTTFAAFLFDHNSRIAMACFTLGFAAGLPVILLLLVNGMALGGMSALFQVRGLGVEWWAWILPHGVTELLAIVLCGAAGLRLGQSLVFPGRRTRLANLMHHGRQVAVVVAGSVVLLFLAALLEGFFRQLIHDLPTKYAVAAATTVLWLVYFTRVGRRVEGRTS